MCRHETAPFLSRDDQTPICEYTGLGRTHGEISLSCMTHSWSTKRASGKSRTDHKERTSSRLPCAGPYGTIQDSSRHMWLIFPDFRSLVLDGTVLLLLFLLDILSNILHCTVLYSIAPSTSTNRWD